MDNIRTFDYARRRKPLTISQAINAHNMMKEPTKVFLKHVGKQRVLDCDEVAEVWGGLMNTVELDDAKTCMALAVDFTMPIRYAGIIRRSAGVTAAFAYCEILKQLTTLSRKELSDDYVVRQAMKKAWAEFENRANEANQVAEGFGCDSSQSWLTLREIGKSPDSQKLRDKMLAIAKLAGRMYESFGYQKKTMPNEDPEEVVGATIGPDLERVMSSELALLADGELEDMQAMKILEGKATMTQMKGVEEKSRGPLVLAIDESGSMHDGDLGDYIWSGASKWNGRNTWAKACAVALTRIAWSENRPVRAVHFGNGTEVQEVPKDDTRALFEMARSFLSGGTSFGSAIKRARAVVGDLDADGFKGADIMLITDGEDSDYDFHNREIDHMDRAGIRLWTVAIGMQIDEEAPVRKRAERYTYAADRDLGSRKAAVRLAEGLDKAALGNAPGAGGMVN